MRQGRLLIAAVPLIWGAAEASLFFIVADVVIGWIALRRGWRDGLIAALFAAVGATLGGAALSLWSAADPARVERLIEAGPAVPQDAVEQARRDLGEPGWRLAMLGSAFKGEPFRVYAAARPGSGGPGLMDFMAATPLVRLPRFMLIALLFGLIGRALTPRVPARVQAGLFAGGWTSFYILFWTLMPG